MKKTYSVAKSSAPPVEWEAYIRTAQKRWKRLLDSLPPEREVQKFFERNPAFVPGADGLGEGAHGPSGNMLYSQPPLPGIASRVPDFMWVTKNSGELVPVFVEIEAPSKPWFTQDGQQHHRLTQAVGQIAQWRLWLDNPANRANFHDLYEIDARDRRLAFRPKFVLIYGRKLEFAADLDRSALRSYLNDSADCTFMTYDRVAPHWYGTDAMTVRLSLKTRKGRVLAFPATFGLGPWTAESIGKLSGVELAIQRMEGVPAKRKQFLLKRLDYWRDWAGDSDKGIQGTGDRE